MRTECTEEKKATYEERLYDMIQNYTVSDIERVLEERINAAGLIITPALVGMAALGSCLYGYDLDARSAFLKFARYRMKLDRGFAEILYDNVYTGLTRMWCVETRVILYSTFPEEYRGPLWFQKRSEQPQKIHLSARALAWKYIETVSQLPAFEDTPQHKNDDREAVAPLRLQIATFCSAEKVQSGGAVWSS